MSNRIAVRGWRSCSKARMHRSRQPDEFRFRDVFDVGPLSALCQEYKISPKTGYKWRERLMRQGLEGIEEESRRPRSSPKQLSEAEVCEMVFPWRRVAAIRNFRNRLFPGRRAAATWRTCTRHSRNPPARGNYG